MCIDKTDPAATAATISATSAHTIPATHTHTLYVVKLVASDGEWFTKVGRTSVGLDARAKGFYPYSVERSATWNFASEGAEAQVRKLEKHIHRMLRTAYPLRCYNPEVRFNGSEGECYKLVHSKVWALVEAMVEARVGN